MIFKHAHLENVVDTMTTKIKMYCNTSNSLLYFLIVGGTLRCMETGSHISSIVYFFIVCAQQCLPFQVECWIFLLKLGTTFVLLVK